MESVFERELPARAEEASGRHQTDVYCGLGADMTDGAQQRGDVERRPRGATRTQWPGALSWCLSPWKIHALAHSRVSCGPTVSAHRLLQGGDSDLAVPRGRHGPGRPTGESQTRPSHGRRPGPSQHPAGKAAHSYILARTLALREEIGHPQPAGMGRESPGCAPAGQRAARTGPRRPHRSSFCRDV